MSALSPGLSIMARARGQSITEITVIGASCVGVTADGALWKWSGETWLRLETSHSAIRRARRIVRYSGHNDVVRIASA